MCAEQTARGQRGWPCHPHSGGPPWVQSISRSAGSDGLGSGLHAGCPLYHLQNCRSAPPRVMFGALMSVSAYPGAQHGEWSHGSSVLVVLLSTECSLLSQLRRGRGTVTVVAAVEGSLSWTFLSSPPISPGKGNSEERRQRTCPCLEMIGIRAVCSGLTSVQPHSEQHTLLCRCYPQQAPEDGTALYFSNLQPGIVSRK